MLHGVVPQMRLSCAMHKRAKAKNMIGNVRRALKAGNCKRAEHIMQDTEFARLMFTCSATGTGYRLHDRLQRCWEKAR